jgi:hypothetical protein
MKLFTVEEANALLPDLRRLLANIRRERAVLQRLEAEVKRASERAAEGGGSVFGSQYATALNRVMQEVQMVVGLGIEIKDFDRGLCDFPHLREGRVVLLCWQDGEERIAWWHEPDGGFAGRQPL